MMGAWRPKHVEWLCRNKTCTVLHQVGVSFDLYCDARKHKIKNVNAVTMHASIICSLLCSLLIDFFFVFQMRLEVSFDQPYRSHAASLPAEQNWACRTVATCAGSVRLSILGLCLLCPVLIRISKSVMGNLQEFYMRVSPEWISNPRTRFSNGPKTPCVLDQRFWTFVRPRPGKFFFHKTRARSQQIYW